MKAKKAGRFLCVLHLLLMAGLLAGILCAFFVRRHPYYETIVDGLGYESTQDFEALMEQDIRQAFALMMLESQFETNGEPDLGKVVGAYQLTGSAPKEVTLQEVMAFASQNGIVIQGGFKNSGAASNNADREEAGADQNTYEISGHEVYFSPYIREDTWYASGFEELCMQKISELNAYYELKQLYKNRSTSFFYRFSLINESAQIISSHNVQPALSSAGLRGLGKYYAYTSAAASSESNLSEPVTKRLTEWLRSCGVSDGYFEIVAGVDTSFTVADHYAAGAGRLHGGKTMYNAVRLISLLSLLGMLGTGIAMVMTHRQRETVTDRLPAEVLLAMGCAVLLTIYYGINLLYDGFLMMYEIDVQSGCVFLFAGYAGLLFVVGSLLRQTDKGGLLSTSLLLRWSRQRSKNPNRMLRTRYWRLRLLWTIARYMAYALSSAVTFSCFVYAKQAGMRFWGEASLCCFIVIQLALIIYATEKQKQKRLLAEELRGMLEGDFGKTPDISLMTGELRTLAEILSRLNEAMDVTVRERTNSERLKTELIANVSHDLKTPLTSIITYTELLKKQPDLTSDRTKEYVQVLQDKAQRLKNLTEDLLEAGKYSTGNVSVTPVKLDFVELIHQMNGEFCEAMEKAGLRLIAKTGRVPVYVRADSRLLWRLLENLYSNAVKYAKPDTSVRVELTQPGGWVVFSMRNISQEELQINAEELLERFVRGDKSRNKEGSGLGLSIAKSIADLLDARLELFPEGDVFRVRLALRAADDMAGFTE